MSPIPALSSSEKAGQLESQLSQPLACPWDSLLVAQLILTDVAADVVPKPKPDGDGDSDGDSDGSCTFLLRQACRVMTCCKRGVTAAHAAAQTRAWRSSLVGPNTDDADESLLSLHAFLAFFRLMIAL